MHIEEIVSQSALALSRQYFLCTCMLFIGELCAYVYLYSFVYVQCSAYVTSGYRHYYETFCVKKTSKHNCWYGICPNLVLISKNQTNVIFVCNIYISCFHLKLCKYGYCHCLLLYKPCCRKYGNAASRLNFLNY